MLQLPKLQPGLLRGLLKCYTRRSSRSQAWPFRNGNKKVKSAQRKAKGKGSTNEDPAFRIGTERLPDLVQMFGLWQRGLFCDVILHASKGTDVRAHKMVLAALGDSLRSMFMDYRQAETVFLDLTAFHVDTVLALLHFVYTTDLKINEHTALQLHACAKHLGIIIAMRICQEYVQKFKMKNAIFYYSIAEKEGKEDLRKLKTEISKTRHFCYMPLEKITQLLSENCLNINESELEIFFAFIRWVDYDKEN